MIESCERAVGAGRGPVEESTLPYSVYVSAIHEALRLLMLLLLFWRVPKRIGTESNRWRPE